MRLQNRINYANLDEKNSLQRNPGTTRRDLDGDWARYVAVGMCFVGEIQLNIKMHMVLAIFDDLTILLKDKFEKFLNFKSHNFEFGISKHFTVQVEKQQSIETP